MLRNEKGIMPIVLAGGVLLGVALALLAYEALYFAQQNWILKSGW